MDSTGADYEKALADASALGYAEADPTADVEGFDAAAKAAILASIAFHTRVTADDVYREGITKVSPDDFVSARALGCTIKLLSICERITTDDGQQRVSARVYPALVPLEHPLATVNGAFNAVVVEAEAAGRLMFYGQGAGGAPTASAVTGDLVMAARNRVLGGRAPQGVEVRPAGRRADGRDSYPLLRQHGRRRQARCIGHGRSGIRASARSASPRSARRAWSAKADGESAPASSWSPTPRPTPPCPKRLMRWPNSTWCRAWPASCGWKEPTNDPVQGRRPPPWPGLIEAYRDRLPVGTTGFPSRCSKAARR